MQEDAGVLPEAATGGPLQPGSLVAGGLEDEGGGERGVWVLEDEGAKRAW